MKRYLGDSCAAQIVTKHLSKAFLFSLVDKKRRNVQGKKKKNEIIRKKWVTVCHA